MKYSGGILLFPFLVASLFTCPAGAQYADPLASVAQRVADQIVQNPTNISPLYAPSFLQAVPEPKLVNLYQSLFDQCGPVLHVTLDSRSSPTHGQFILACKDAQMRMTLDIEPDPPHRVTGLFFGPPAARVKSLDELAKKFADLPGKTTFQIQRLDDGKILASHNPDSALAIGSTFKLYILATLCHQKINWNKIVTIQDQYKSLPTGDLRTWPAGFPITLHTLALKMISESDNTGADHLLAIAGRQNVQEMLPELGMKNPPANIPFLSTLELFRLKAAAPLRQKYLAADVAGRQAMLAQMLGTPPPSADIFSSGRPIAIDQIEWFASADDLCRLMKWLDTNADAQALAILAVNPGLGFSTKDFPYIAYKGGSEPGVLNMTWLLHSRAGRHYALTASWNNPAADVDLNQFAALMLAAADQIAAQP